MMINNAINSIKNIIYGKNDFKLLKLKIPYFPNIEYRKEIFGYRLLTDQKQYYMENYPKIVIENANIDEVVLMMMKGEKI